MPAMPISKKSVEVLALGLPFEARRELYFALADSINYFPCVTMDCDAILEDIKQQVSEALAAEITKEDCINGAREVSDWDWSSEYAMGKEAVIISAIATAKARLKARA